MVAFACEACLPPAACPRGPAAEGSAARREDALHLAKCAKPRRTTISEYMENPMDFLSCKRKPRKTVKTIYIDCKNKYPLRMNQEYPPPRGEIPLGIPVGKCARCFLSGGGLRIPAGQIPDPVGAGARRPGTGGEGAELCPLPRPPAPLSRGRCVPCPALGARRGAPASGSPPRARQNHGNLGARRGKSPFHSDLPPSSEAHLAPNRKNHGNLSRSPRACQISCPAPQPSNQRGAPARNAMTTATQSRTLHSGGV